MKDCFCVPARLPVGRTVSVGVLRSTHVLRPRHSLDTLSKTLPKRHLHRLALRKDVGFPQSVTHLVQAQPHGFTSRLLALGNVHHDVSLVVIDDGELGLPCDGMPQGDEVEMRANPDLFPVVVASEASSVIHICGSWTGRHTRVVGWNNEDRSDNNGEERDAEESQ